MAFKRKARSKRTRRPRKRTKKSGKVKSFAARVKKVIMKTAESKHLNYSFGKVEVFHNSFMPFHITNSAIMPIMGIGPDQRIGDQISVGGFMLRMMLGQKSDRPNVNWKWYIMRVNKGVVYAYNTWFENVINNCLLDPPNKDYVTVLKSGNFKHTVTSLEVGESAKEQTYSKKIWIPYKKTYRFGPGNGAQAHNDHELYFIVAPFDAYGTLLSDNIGYVQCMRTMYYKDI